MCIECSQCKFEQFREEFFLRMILKSVNGVLQGRANLLQIDSISRKDYLNLFNRILNQTNRIFSSLTSILNTHLNLNQSLTIQSSSIHFSLEKSFDFSYLLIRVSIQMNIQNTKILCF